MSGFWLSPIKEDHSEEEEMTILDYNNEFKQLQNKQDLVKFSSIIQHEEFLLNQELVSLERQCILINVSKASKFFHSPKQEYVRFFFEGFLLAFFEDEPQYRSHIKRKLKMKEVTQIQQLSHDRVRLDFGEKDFIEFQVLIQSEVSESLDEIDESEEPLSKVEITPQLVIRALRTVSDFLNSVGQSTNDKKLLLDETGAENGGDNSTEATEPTKTETTNPKMKSMLRVAKEVNSVTNLDKRQSAMYINRHSREEFMDAVGKEKLESIEEEGSSKEKLVFGRARKVFKALRMAEKDFLELDLQIHATLEGENHILQNKIEKTRKKFIKATKRLQKVLKYGQFN